MLQLIHVATNGGAEKHTRLITKAFAQKGLSLTIVYPPGPYAAEFAQLSRFGVECIEYDLKKSILASILFIRRLIIKKRINVIHSHMHGADIIAALARLGLRRVRHISTIHWVAQDNARFWFKLRTVFVTFVAFQLADKIFGVSRTVTQRVRRTMFLPASKMATTFNCIDFEEMKPDTAEVQRLHRELKSDKSSIVLLCVGLLYWVKGQRYLIDAFDLLKEKYPSLLLVLLGTGEHEQRLKKQVACLGLEGRILFPGFQRNVPDWLSIADIYIQPSLHDPLPRALLEAMYMGLPVVVSDIETLCEVVSDGVTGRTARSQSAAALAEAISYMLDNPQKAREMGQNASEFVQANCSMETMAEKILTTLNSLTGWRVRR